MQSTVVVDVNRPLPRGQAFDQIRTKTGAGRNTRAKTPALHVEQAPCPRGGLHVLTNRGEVTLCAGCGAGWAELDAGLRGQR